MTVRVFKVQDGKPSSAALTPTCSSEQEPKGAVVASYWPATTEVQNRDRVILLHSAGSHHSQKLTGTFSVDAPGTLRHEGQQGSGCRVMVFDGNICCCPDGLRVAITSSTPGVIIQVPGAASRSVNTCQIDSARSGVRYSSSTRRRRP